MEQMFTAAAVGDGLRIATEIFSHIVKKRLREDFGEVWYNALSDFLGREGAAELELMDARHIYSMIANGIGFGGDKAYCEKVRGFVNYVAHMDQKVSSNEANAEREWEDSAACLKDLLEMGAKERFSFSGELCEYLDKYIDGVPSLSEKDVRQSFFAQIHRLEKSGDTAEVNALLCDASENKGDVTAMLELARLYRTGFFTNGTPDFERSLAWAQKAFEADVTPGTTYITEYTAKVKEIFENAKRGDVESVTEALRLHTQGIWLPKNWDVIISYYDFLQSKKILTTREALLELVGRGVEGAAAVVAARGSDRMGLLCDCHSDIFSVLETADAITREAVLRELSEKFADDAKVISAKLCFCENGDEAEGKRILDAYVESYVTERSGGRYDFRLKYACEKLFEFAETYVDKMYYLRVSALYCVDDESKKAQKTFFDNTVKEILESDTVCSIDRYEMIHRYRELNEKAFAAVGEQFWNAYLSYAVNGKELLVFFDEDEKCRPYSSYLSYIAQGTEAQARFNSEIERLKKEYEDSKSKEFSEMAKRLAESLEACLKTTEPTECPQNRADAEKAIDTANKNADYVESCIRQAQDFLKENFRPEYKENASELEKLTEALSERIAQLTDVRTEAVEKLKEIEKEEARSAELKKTVILLLATLGLLAVSTAAYFGIKLL